MRTNLFGAILVTLLFIGAAVAALFSVRYFFLVREFQSLQGGLQRINATLTAAQALANEAKEFSKANPAIDPILYDFEMKPRPAGMAAPAPNLPPLR